MVGRTVVVSFGICVLGWEGWQRSIHTGCLSMFGAGYPWLFWALVSSRLSRARAQRLVCVMDEGQKAIRMSVQDTGVVNHRLCEGEAVV